MDNADANFMMMSPKEKILDIMGDYIGPQVAHLEPMMHEVAVTAFFCLKGEWLDATRRTHGKLHPEWAADETWFGPGFDTRIQVKNGKSHLNMQHVRTGMAQFGLKLGDTLAHLLPQVKLALLSSNDNRDWRVLVQRLRLFEFRRGHMTEAQQSQARNRLYVQERIALHEAIYRDMAQRDLVGWEEAFWYTVAVNTLGVACLMGMEAHTGAAI